MTTNTDALPNNIKTNAPEGISSEHLFELAKMTGLIGPHSVKEVNDRIVGYARVVLNDNAVQEAFVRSNRDCLAVAPSIQAQAVLVDADQIAKWARRMTLPLDDSECVALVQEILRARGGDDLTRELFDMLQATVKHFTKTPSTLADSKVRGTAHEVIAKAYARLGYAPPGSPI